MLSRVTPPPAQPAAPGRRVAVLTHLGRREAVETAAGSTDRASAELRREGALLTAAYCVGMADRLAELAVEYAQERKQFDRPIGSFQALKHILADMAVRIELARVSVHAAACVMDDPTTGGSHHVR